ncbi:MAG: carbohydrate ABC transporter permease [Gemmatimonadales bacterium]
MKRTWAAAAATAATVAAALALIVVHVAQRHYERQFAFRIAHTTAAYITAVTPPPPPPRPPPAPRAPRTARGRRAPVPPPPPPPAPPAPPAPSSPAARSYHLPSLLTQARALRTLPGWSSDVEVYFGTAPLVDATAAPLTPIDLNRLESAGERWRSGSALVPLKDRDNREVVGAVEVRPRPLPHGPLPGGMGFAFPAAILAVSAAAAIAFRERSLRNGGYIGAALLLALACYVDVRTAARQSTDRWLLDTRRLLQEAATRMPAPRTRVTISDLAALVRDGEVVPGEPGESAPRRVRIEGSRRAVAAVLIGAGRWVDLRSAPAEIEAPRWLILLLPCALIGPLAILMLRWAERTPASQRRQTAVAWGFVAPAALHLAVFTIGPTFYAVYLARLASLPTLLRDPVTWISFRNAGIYALYVPVSVALALAAALAVHRYRDRWRGRLFSAAFLLPYAASVVTVALLWQVMYRSGSLGLGKPDWLSSARTALPALMLMSLWAHAGGQMLVFLAGLQRIPQAYLDAARVDGAGAWRRFWRITLPLLRPITGFVIVTGLLSALQLFTFVSVLTQGGPLQSTEVPVHHVYQTAFGSYAFGGASALALLIFVVLLVFRWPQLRLLGRQVADA